jgi:cardiolipin synthase A/B
MNDIWRALLHLGADPTLGIGFVLAVGVTIHILLRKREVASAVGWIGLVWFAPILGAIFYVIFGVNRVRRRARRMRPQDGQGGSRPESAVGVEDGLLQLAHAVGRITNRPLRPGTKVEIYQNGDQAYPAMLQAIAAAKVSVGLSSYIFRGDQWGNRFITALADARARGVEVRVLIDGVGGGWIASPAYHRLQRRGVKAARFLHSILPWRMPFVNLRSHKKILLIDGTIGFTGGMNIADENVMATNPKEPVQDIHFRVEGPVVSQLSEAFVQDWAFVTDEDLAEDKWSPPILVAPGALARVIDSGPDEDLEKVEFAILQAIACARNSVAVITPYFLPDDRLITALTLAAMRGVAVDLVIPGKSDHMLVDWATRANIDPLLAEGVRIWRSPPPFHHSKMMIVDNEWCLIGSTNWDMRSFRLNFELCMEVYDRELAANLTALMASLKVAELTRAELDARGFIARLRDAAARLMLPYL